MAEQEARKRKSPDPMRRLKKKARSPKAKKKSMRRLTPAVIKQQKLKNQPEHQGILLLSLIVDGQGQAHGE